MYSIDKWLLYEHIGCIINAFVEKNNIYTTDVFVVQLD